MTLAVIDASVAAKWFLPARGETLMDEAFHLLRRYAKGELQLLVPDLFWAELANIFWKAIRQRRWEKPAAERALASLDERRLATVSSRSVLEVAFGIATAFDRTVYDALYVALAVHAKAQFITADERLANALAAQLPVKWLGAV
ncbi:MAG: type II toxin-antitoxin system VapC family toxin [Terriglobales bacterium]